MFDESYPLELLEKQIKINGKYSTMAEKALAKRSISTAVEILQDVRGFSFETLELAI